MQRQPGIDTATAELYRCFEMLNRDLFGTALPLPMITIQRGGKGVLGWVTVQKIWTATDTTQADSYEINVVAENLARTPMQIAGTLLHEMCHLHNLCAGLRDCTGHQYHNHLFRDTAEAAGLTVTKFPRYGFALTEIGPTLAAKLGTSPVNPAAFSHYRQADTVTVDPITGKRTGATGKPLGPRGGKGIGKMLKWSCGCTNVRCATVLQASCRDCGNEFLPC